MRLAIATLLGLASVARAQPPGMADQVTPSAPVDGRDTDRIQLGLGGVMYASYPMSIEDPAIAAFVARPLWHGTRHRYVQVMADASLVAGYGTDSRSAHVAIAPRVGVNLYLGSVFGFELRMGPALLAQLGRDTVAGVGLTGSGAYVFRLWDDDRKRLKLLVHMHAGGYLAEDPGNDLGTNAMAMGLGVGYETPL